MDNPRGCSRTATVCFVQPLDIAQIAAFIAGAESDGDTRGSRARRTANAVHISFRHIRQIKIEHVRDVVDVDAARRDIRGDKQTGLAGLEILQRARALALALVAMDCFGGDMRFLKLSDQLVGAVLGPREHHRPRDFRIFQKINQQTRLALLIDVNDALIHQRNGGSHALGLNPYRLTHIGLREVSDFTRHGRGEEQRLARLRQQLHDPVQGAR